MGDEWKLSRPEKQNLCNLSAIPPSRIKHTSRQHSAHTPAIKHAADYHKSVRLMKENGQVFIHTVAAVFAVGKLHSKAI